MEGQQMYQVQKSFNYNYSSNTTPTNSIPIVGCQTVVGYQRVSVQGGEFIYRYQDKPVGSVEESRFSGHKPNVERKEGWESGRPGGMDQCSFLKRSSFDNKTFDKSIGEAGRMMENFGEPLCSSQSVETTTPVSDLAVKELTATFQQKRREIFYSEDDWKHPVGHEKAIGACRKSEPYQNDWVKHRTGVGVMNNTCQHKKSKKNPKKRNMPPQQKAKPLKQAEKDKLKLAVVPSTHQGTELTELEGHFLQKKLTELVLDETEEVTIQIKKTSLENGVLAVICASEETVSWLKRLNGTELWEGASMVVGNYNSILGITMISLRTDNAQLSGRQVLEMLERQNPDVKTGDWRILHRRQEESHQVLVACIGKASAEALKRQKWKVFLGLRKVAVREITDQPREKKWQNGAYGLHWVERQGKNIKKERRKKVFI